MTLKQFYDDVFKNLDFLNIYQEGDSNDNPGNYYYSTKEDSRNPVGYEYIWFMDWEITSAPDELFTLTCLHDTFKPITGTVDDIASFLIGNAVAFQINAHYEGESTGNEFYKQGFLQGLNDVALLTKPVPPKAPPTPDGLFESLTKTE